VVETENLSAKGVPDMFERYNEKARRVVFFARYEASILGSPEIGDEHLLLGMMREDKDLMRRHLGEAYLAQELRDAIAALAVFDGESSATSVDLPLKREAKRVLAYAAEEAMRLGNPHIGTEHLLLGLLREEGGLSARLLRERGLTIEAARDRIAKAGKDALKEPAAESGVPGRLLAGFRAARTVGTPIRITGEGSSEPLLAYQGAPPLVGEAIQLRAEGQAARRYRVKDVVWNFVREENGSRLADVEVVVAELSGEG